MKSVALTFPKDGYTGRYRNRMLAAWGHPGQSFLAFEDALHSEHPIDAIWKALDGTEDCSCLYLEMPDAGEPAEAHTVYLMRSEASFEDLYYCNDPDRFLAGHSFAELLRRRAPRLNAPAADAFVCHMLFGTVPVPGTYIANVQRLAPGEMLTWSRKTGTFELSRMRRIVSRPATNRDLDGSGLEAALQGYMDGVDSGHVWNTLSGGVDSTLLQTFLPAGSHSVSLTFADPQFDYERTYARDASELLHTKHMFVEVSEDDVLPRFKRVLANAAIPPTHVHQVHFEEMLEKTGSDLISGNYADCTFGLDIAGHVYDAMQAKSRVEKLARWVSRFPALADRFAYGGRFKRWKLADRATVALRLYRSLSLPIAHWKSYPSQVYVSRDLDMLSQMVSWKDIERAVLGRMDTHLSTFQAVDPQAKGAAAHLEAAQWIDLRWSDAGQIRRQIAYAQGRRVYLPYACRSVFEASQAMPRDIRFYKDGVVKPVMKSLLQKRLPAYDVYKKKGYSSIPRAGRLRLLRNWIERESLELPAEASWPRILRSAHGGTLERAVVYAVWMKAIKENYAVPAARASASPHMNAVEIANAEPVAAG
jgi:hypothetical protein